MAVIEVKLVNHAKGFDLAHAVGKLEWDMSSIGNPV